MSEPTDIEKKSLEAHVELCAERYRSLEDQFDTVKQDISDLKSMVYDVRIMMSEMSKKNNERIINWGIGIISVLIAIIGYLLANHVVFK